MKRLLIAIPSYRWGGDTTALFNLLNRLDTNQFKVDLFPILDEGPYRERFTNCSLLRSSAILESMLRKYSFSFNPHSILAFGLKALNRLSRGRMLNTIYRNVGRKLVKATEYDAVIAWTEWNPTTFVSFIPHKYKVAWIHCDYTFDNHEPYELEAYRRVNRIVHVSFFCKNQFLGLYPEFKDKSVVVHNILDIRQIAEKSQEQVEDYPIGEGFHILSFGRIAPGKRFSHIPGIAAAVRDSGVSFHWTIMGPDQHPDELERIRKNIAEHHVQDCVSYLGSRSNPFPYIKRADLVVNTSASEAHPLAILESMILETPTINADFKAAYEVVDDGRNGLIVPLERIADAVKRFITDEQLRNRLQESLKDFHYSDDTAMKEFEQLFSHV